MAADLPEQDSEFSSPVSAINVTPFVDVTLVLLVIFLVTAPMMMKETMNIRLPKTATSDGKKVSTLSVVVTRGGNILLNGVMAGETEVKMAVVDALKDNPETQAVISADQEALHKDLVKALDWIKAAGLNKFAIQVEREEGNE